MYHQEQIGIPGYRGAGVGDQRGLPTLAQEQRRSMGLHTDAAGELVRQGAELLTDHMVDPNRPGQKSTLQPPYEVENQPVKAGPMICFALSYLH
jgi:hypothetical protein